MNILFYKLIYNVKIKRWLFILDHLEEIQSTTAKKLSIETGSTIRTIQADIKELKKYFCESISILGSDDGYHFSFRNPSEYIRKKQGLLNDEPLFLFLDYLFDDIQKNNQEWSSFLSISPASFSRIKRSLAIFLEKKYQIKIISTKNTLTGEEAAIRQLMYDFYFTLPIYPKMMEEKVAKISNFSVKIYPGRWDIDSVLFNRWLKLACWRIEQGYMLPEKEGAVEVEQKIVNDLNQIAEISLPAQEKAALFLISLKEEQFINPLVQKEFLRQFSPSVQNTYPVMDLDSMPILLFDTITYLMKHFFHLPPVSLNEQSEANETPETFFLKNMKSRYLELKKKVQKSLLLSFDLEGTTALQQWIRNVVRKQLILSGFHLLENNQVHVFPFVYKILITNKKMSAEEFITVFLPKIPEENEIKQALKRVK